MEKLCATYNVSRETFDKLKIYQSMLNDWQQKFNLVSKSTLEDAWNRHFLDSVQLIQYIPDTARVLYDFGSGAGFPGMVIAAVAAEKLPKLKVNLVESTSKKTVYLNAVKEKLGIDVAIHNDRIEKLPIEKADVITSRALASLSELLEYSYRFCHKGSVCIFPKGKKYSEELAEAHKKWRFKCRVEPSMQSDEGRILIITDLSKKGGNKCQGY